MDTDKLITYRQFGNYLSAEIVKGRLESEGIPCFLINENILYAFPAVSGIKLQIREADKEKADAVLSQEA